MSRHLSSNFKFYMLSSIAVQKFIWWEVSTKSMQDSKNNTKLINSWNPRRVILWSETQLLAQPCISRALRKFPLLLPASPFFSGKQEIFTLAIGTLLAYCDIHEDTCGYAYACQHELVFPSFLSSSFVMIYIGKGSCGCRLLHNYNKNIKEIIVLFCGIKWNFFQELH